MIILIFQQKKMIHKIMDIYIILKNEKYVKYMNSSSLNDISKTKIGLEIYVICIQHSKYILHTPNFRNWLMRNQNNIDYKSAISRYNKSIY